MCGAHGNLLAGGRCTDNGELAEPGFFRIDPDQLAGLAKRNLCGSGRHCCCRRSVALLGEAESGQKIIQLIKVSIVKLDHSAMAVERDPHREAKLVG